MYVCIYIYIYSYIYIYIYMLGSIWRFRNGVVAKRGPRNGTHFEMGEFPGLRPDLSELHNSSIS